MLQLLVLLSASLLVHGFAPTFDEGGGSLLESVFETARGALFAPFNPAPDPVVPDPVVPDPVVPDLPSPDNEVVYVITELSPEMRDAQASPWYVAFEAGLAAALTPGIRFKFLSLGIAETNGMDVDRYEASIHEACQQRNGGAILFYLPYLEGSAEYERIDNALNACLDERPDFPIFSYSSDTYHNPRLYGFIGMATYSMGERCARALLFTTKDLGSDRESSDAVAGRRACPATPSEEFEQRCPHKVCDVHWPEYMNEEDYYLRLFSGLNHTLSMHGARAEKRTDTLTLTDERKIVKRTQLLMSTRGMSTSDATHAAFRMALEDPSKFPNMPVGHVTIFSSGYAAMFPDEAKLHCGFYVDGQNTWQMGEDVFRLGLTAMQTAAAAMSIPYDEWRAARGNNEAETTTNSVQYANTAKWTDTISAENLQRGLNVAKLATLAYEYEQGASWTGDPDMPTLTCGRDDMNQPLQGIEETLFGSGPKCSIIQDVALDLKSSVVEYTSESDTASGASMFVAKRGNNEYVVSFAGTADSSDLVADLASAISKYVELGPGRETCAAENCRCTAGDGDSTNCKYAAGRGFVWQYEELRAAGWNAEDFCREAGDSTIIVTGHSLGGALANIGAVDLKLHGCEVKLHTFSSPRVWKEGAELLDDEFPEIDDKAIAAVKAAGMEAVKKAMQSGGDILSVKVALRAALKGVGSNFTDALLDTAFAAGSKFDAMQAAIDQGGIAGVAALGEELETVLDALACLPAQGGCLALLDLGVRNADSVLAAARTSLRLSGFLPGTASWEIRNRNDVKGADFVKGLAIDSTRWVSEGDVVPSLPPAAMGYEHVGTRVINLKWKGAWWSNAPNPFKYEEADADFTPRVSNLCEYRDAISKALSFVSGPYGGFASMALCAVAAVINSFGPSGAHFLVKPTMVRLKQAIVYPLGLPDWYHHCQEHIDCESRTCYDSYDGEDSQCCRAGEYASSVLRGKYCTDKALWEPDAERCCSRAVIGPITGTAYCGPLGAGELQVTYSDPDGSDDIYCCPGNSPVRWCSGWECKEPGDVCTSGSGWTCCDQGRSGCDGSTCWFETDSLPDADVCSPQHPVGRSPLLPCAPVDNPSYSGLVVNARVVATQGADGFINPAMFPAHHQLGGKNVVAISGGGARAFACGIGALRALHKLDLMSKVGGLAGVSGGNWVAGIYMFQQQHTTSELLGIEDSDVVDPSTLTTEVLNAPPVPLGGPAAGVLLPGQVGSQATRSATWPLVVTTIDARHMGGDKYLLDKEIAGREEDATAHFFKDVRVAAELYGLWGANGLPLWGAHPGGTKIHEGTDVDAQTFARSLEAEAAKRGAEHCILYIHGYKVSIGDALETVDAMNKYLDGKTPGAFVVPIIWPAEESFIDNDNLAVTYPQQKADAPGAARALRILLKKLGDANITLPISVMAHSMGNYLLGQFAPDADETPAFIFENIFMVAADIRASTFDASEGPEARGAGIVRIAKNKIHILHNREDKALIARVATNSLRLALGLVGLSTTDESQLIGKDMLVIKDCSEWTSVLGLGPSHSYQSTEEAMDYYLESLAGPGARKRKLRDLVDHA